MKQAASLPPIASLNRRDAKVPKCQRFRQFAIRNSQFILPALLALLLYPRSLALPFFYDDPLNFNWMAGRTVWSFWVDSTDYAYYRPLVFTLWWAMQRAFGATNAVAFEGLSITIHIGVAWLTGWIAGRLFRDRSLSRTAALLGGSFWVAFPFAAQVVPNAGSAFHIYLPFLTLAAVAAALKYRDTGHRRWAVVAWAIGALAPFAHESGVVTGAIMGLAVLLVEGGGGSLPSLITRHPLFAIRNSQLVVPCLVTFSHLLFFLLWRSIPKTGGAGLTWVGWESVYQSAAYFSQGFSFPLAWLTGPLVRQGMSDVIAALGVGAASLVFLAVIFAWARDWRTPLLCAGWYVVAALPSVFGLGFHYIVTSLRLLAFPGIAACILWSAAIVRLAHRATPVATRNWQLLIAVPLAALLLLPSVVFVTREMRLHLMANTPTRQIASAIRAAPAEGHLVVNPPEWAAWQSATYALGHEAVLITPSYLTFADVIHTNTGVRPRVEAVQFSNVKTRPASLHYFVNAPEADWIALAAMIPEYDHVWVVRYYDDEIRADDVGRVLEGSVPEGHYVARFDERVTLEAATLDVSGHEAIVRLQWRMSAPSGEDAFVHLLDCAGDVLALADGAPLGRTYPFWVWPPGQRALDIRHLSSSDKSAKSVDCYLAEIGLFNPADLTRVPAFDANGRRYENDAVVIKP